MNTSLIYFLLLPELYFFFAIFYLLTYTTINNLSSFYKFPNLLKNNLFFLILSLVNISFFILNYINISEFSIFNFFYKDTFVSFLQLFTIFFTILILFVTYSYINNNKIGHFEFFIVLFFSVFSLCLLVTSNHMINMYLLLELQGFSSYILTALNRKNQYSVESGLKYFILGSFSSILLLFGISILYGFSGLLSFVEINLFLENIDLFFVNVNINVVSVSFIFILISFLFKLYAAPFHLWVSDIYQGAPMMVTTFFSVVPLLSTFFIFSKLLLVVFYKLNIIYYPIITITIVSSFLLGTFGAIYQKKIKRLLAYSSVTSIGYFLLLFISETPMMLVNVYSYIFIYSISLLTVFSIFLQLYLNKKNLYIEQFSSLKGYVFINKYLSVILLFSLFSIAGIPPFSLFISKLFLLTNLSFENNYFFVFIILIITILSSYYYLKIIKIIFFNKNKSWIHLKNLNFISSFLLTFFIIVQLYFFYNPSIFTTMLKYSLFSMFSM